MIKRSWSHVVKGIATRSMVSDDVAFILATWLRSYKESSEFAKRITHKVFFTSHHEIAKSLLSRSRCIVAHLADEPEIIIGYVVFEPGESPLVHYVFTKRGWRKLRIAHDLIEQAQINIDGCEFTHWTYFLNEYFSKHPTMTYNPYKIG